MAYGAVGGPTPVPTHHILTMIGPASGVGKGCDPLTLESEDPPVEEMCPVTFVGYQTTLAADGAAPEGFTMHRIESNSAPVGVILVTLCEPGCGGHSIIQPTYSGTAPSVGAQVVADGLGGVRAAVSGEVGIGEVMRICETAADGTKRLDLLI